MSDRRLILFVALLLDLFIGDPPNRWHPVAWMGSLIGWTQRRSPAADPERQLLFGGLIAIGGAGAVAVFGWLVDKMAMRLPRPLYWLAGGLALKTTFSMRGLVTAAEDIYCSLVAGDVSEAQRLASWHLVSRDTSKLDASQVAAATIESVAENTSDGFIAPLLYYTWLGLPGALAYRFANTADAMLGYRDSHREWLGKAPARLDDLFNFIPARLTAFLIIAAARLTGCNAHRAWSIWRRDRSKTASPNAGQPMSAAAGALGVELEKVGHYKLGEGQNKPETVDIIRSLRLAQIAALLGVALAFLALRPVRR